MLVDHNCDPTDNKTTHVTCMLRKGTKSMFVLQGIPYLVLNPNDEYYVNKSPPRAVSHAGILVTHFSNFVFQYFY
jgi:hypothetical protein